MKREILRLKAKIQPKIAEIEDDPKKVKCEICGTSVGKKQLTIHKKQHEKKLEKMVLAKNTFIRKHFQ